MARAAIAALIVALCACSTNPPPAEITSWAGTTPHLEVVGMVNGEALSISLTDAAASDPTTLHCLRRYEVPIVNGKRVDARGRLFEFVVSALVTVAGEQRLLALDVNQHDTQSDAPGTSVTIVPRDDEHPPPSADAWFDWQWRQPASLQLTYEAAALEGTFAVGEHTGAPDAGGLVVPAGEGAIGGFLTAQWSVVDKVTLSFTAACTEDTVEEILY